MAQISSLGSAMIRYGPHQKIAAMLLSQYSTTVQYETDDTVYAMINNWLKSMNKNEARDDVIISMPYMV